MIQYNKSTNRYNSRFYSHFSTHSLLSPPMTTSIFYLILPSRLLELRVAELSCWLFVSRKQATSLPAHCMCYLLYHFKMIWQCMGPSIRLDQCTYPQKKVFIVGCYNIVFAIQLAELIVFLLKKGFLLYRINIRYRICDYDFLIIHQREIKHYLKE